MRFVRRLFTSFACLALVGCATSQANRLTPSGRPEVVLTGQTKRAVMELLVNDLVNQGYTLVKADDFTATFEKSGGLLMNLLMGSRFNPETKYRLAFNFVETGGGVRVIGTLGLVTNPGSGFEKTMALADGNGSGARQVQTMLDEFAGRHAGVAVAVTPVSSSAPANSTTSASEAPGVAHAAAEPFVPARSSPPTSASRDARRPVANRPTTPSTSARALSKPAARAAPADPGPPRVEMVPASDSSFARTTIGVPVSEAARQEGARAYKNGQVFYKRVEWAKAEAWFREAVRLDGSVAAYHAALGSVLMVLEEWRDAEAEYTAAVLIDVDNADYRAALKAARSRR